MIARAARVRNDFARVALLALLFIPTVLELVILALLPTALGGHPNKRRVLQADYYERTIAVFLAAMRGDFL